MTETNCLPVRS